MSLHATLVFTPPPLWRRKLGSTVSDGNFVKWTGVVTLPTVGPGVSRRLVVKERQILPLAAPRRTRRTSLVYSDIIPIA